MSWDATVSAAYVTGFLAFCRLCFSAPVMPDDAFENHPLSDEPADQPDEDPT
ncbi:hypothetical protein MKK63_00020 [Methylobacterium sp. J-088]|uniref:hypothetical protein n=1 Tax=Methylobacterium sp. J-088 TaxID=2836664 RepID=UPI001FB883E7|nr:hypothetical protein [Methylobacterium sp. J-088]MCJ2061116.1 hypothetical protein [Methylobacterium sp. J-088]